MRIFLILFFILSSLLSAGSLGEEQLRSAIVKVYTVTKNPSYSVPWSSSIQQISGSGSVIEGDRILTNAHVVANRTFIEVQRYGERHRYIAHVEAVSHQLDLALLKVDDPSFFKGITPLKLGKLPQIEQKVSVYGFPMGGDTLSVTAGVVSRIEHQQYVHSGESFLAIQIDAAVNPGNSGGPAISDGRIVGVVMEGIQKAQSISYLVPTVMVRHFLKDIKDGHLDGVPAFAALTQSMENPALRKRYGLIAGEGGVLVDKIISTGGLEGILKAGDVITAIDGHKIQEDATVAFRQNEFTNYEYFAQLHQRGEKARLQILRQGKKMEREVPLLKQAKDLLLVGTYRYDQMPRYAILGGYVFAPLTRNLAVRVARSRIDLIPYVEDFVQKDRREVVLLLRVLPSALSRGDYSRAFWPIETINGEKIVDFDDFYHKLTHSKSETIILKNKVGEEVVIDRKEALKMQPMILRRYNIEYDRSEDLR
ncbi:S1C family serine protease [Nitratifractor sp.]|uniref:S1C family serine protease n=1 Tax=Nitratifractor sp. TaxID=2268144 RepID=UPI0025CF0D66|nr:S1C family serine protease [Nitratifractor sp.]